MAIQVNIEDLASKASQMSAKASEASADVASAYTSIAEMSNYWKGFAYDYFAGVLNQNVKSLNQCFEYLAKTGPDELVAKAKDYNEANNSESNVTVSLSDPTTVVNIEMTGTGADFTYDTNGINTLYSNVTTQIENAILAIGEVSSLLEAISWQGAAAKATKDQMRTDINAIKAMISDVKTSYSQAITANDAMVTAKETGMEIVDAFNSSVQGAMEAVQDTVEQVAKAADEAATRAWTAWKSFTSGGTI